MTAETRELGNRFFAVVRDRELTLITKSTRPVPAAAVRVLVGFGPFVVIGLSFVWGVPRLVVDVLTGAVALNAAMYVFIPWFVGLFASVVLSIFFAGAGKPTRVRLRRGLRNPVARWCANLGGGDADAILSVRFSRRGEVVSTTQEVAGVFNLRVQQDGIEDPPVGEHAKVIRGRGLWGSRTAWWLRFETRNYEPWCIALAVDDGRADDLAALITDTLGVECIVVRRIDDQPA